MKPGMTISCVAHAVALGFAVVAISAQPMNAPPVQSLDTQIISEKDFSQMTKGVKNAQQTKDAKALADKVGDEKSVDQLAPKAADKPPITTDAKADAPKPDQQKPDQKTASKADSKPDPKPDPKPDAKVDPKPPDPKPDPKAAEKPKTPEYKPDQIANLLKKDAAKDAKANDNSAQQKQNAPKFNANQVAELLDQRAPQRQLASASQINNTATLGTQTGAAAELSQSEEAAFIARVRSCWNLPPGVDTATNITVTFYVRLNRDGTLAGQPSLDHVQGPPSMLGPALAESAKRALLQCQPYTMFKPEHYDQWRELLPDFNPSLMSGG